MDTEITFLLCIMGPEHIHPGFYTVLELNCIQLTFLSHWLGMFAKFWGRHDARGT